MKAGDAADFYGHIMGNADATREYNKVLEETATKFNVNTKVTDTWGRKNTDEASRGNRVKDLLVRQGRLSTIEAGVPRSVKRTGSNLSMGATEAMTHQGLRVIGRVGD